VGGGDFRAEGVISRKHAMIVARAQGFVFTLWLC
jgi:hypothetical protein